VGEAQEASAGTLAEAVGALPGVTGTRFEKDELVAFAARESLPALMTMLRDDPRFAFEQCMDVCGVDWPDRAERFEVVYNLLSVSLNQRLRVIVSTDEATPVPSVCAIWPAVTWWEREAWDLYGIVFAGQPDLRRILTDYGFEGHPLRKDFPLLARLVKPWPGIVDVEPLPGDDSTVQDGEGE
jgi:NADH-quinone oxidoreductase subunit C